LLDPHVRVRVARRSVGSLGRRGHL
jgi:hypothetical protein